MLTRPSLRAVIATTSAAALLVGGADLASYAATHHGPSRASGSKSAQPRAITFHLGQVGAQYNAGSAHVFTAKVPKGTYRVSMSGLLTETGGSGDAIVCTIADKTAFVRLIEHPSAHQLLNRLYELVIQNQSDDLSTFGLFEGTNPVVKISRTITYGCLLEGSGTFTVGRVPVFTLTPVKSDNQKGKPLPIAKADLRAALRASD